MPASLYSSSTKKTHLNIVAIGSIDSGKSTTLGHLMYKCGEVDKETIDNLENEASEIGKGSFKYAWVFDKLKAERERGITIDISQQKFETPKHIVTIIDTPGHKDYTKNFLTGVSQADIVLIIVPAKEDELEAALSKKGKLREQLLAAYSFQVKKFIIAVNKMDSVNWSESAFKNAVSSTRSILKIIGINIRYVPFVPISGWNGDNLVEPSPFSTWFNESSDYYTNDYFRKTLFDTIDAFDAPARPSGKPLRIPVENVYNIENIGTVPVGCISTGVLKPGMFVTFAPTQLTSEVKSIEMYHEPLDEAVPGDNIGFNIDDIDVSEIKRGYVAGQFDNYQPLITAYFIADITVINHPGQIHPGYTPIVDCHTAHVACKFAELITTIDPRTGQPLENGPKYLKQGDTAMVKLYPAKPMYIEDMASFPSLGSLVIRDLGKIVAVGVVKSVERSDEFTPLD